MSRPDRQGHKPSIYPPSQQANWISLWAILTARTMGLGVYPFLFHASPRTPSRCSGGASFAAPAEGLRRLLPGDSGPLPRQPPPTVRAAPARFGSAPGGVLRRRAPSARWGGERSPAVTH